MRDYEKLDFGLVGVVPNVPYQSKEKTVDLTGKRVLAVAGDVGGWRAIEPPLLKALEAGAQVELYLVAGSAKLFAEGNLHLDRRFAVTDTVHALEGPGVRLYDLVVLGASQTTEGVETAWAILRNSESPVLAVQDMYGSLHPLLIKLRILDAVHSIDRVCVGDEFSADMMLADVYKTFSGNAIVVTGGPQFDTVVALKEYWNEERAKMRAKLQVTNDHLVFLLGGGMNGTAEMLSLVHNALRQTELTDRARVVCRMHPTRASQLDLDLVSAKKADMRDIHFADTLSSDKIGSEQLLPAADFVLTGYSTLNYFGILSGMLGVIYVGTPSFRCDLMEEKGLLKPPEAEAGAGWYVQTVNDLAAVMRSCCSLVPSPEVVHLIDAQAKICQYNDGHATDRVFNEMVDLM